MGETVIVPKSISAPQSEEAHRMKRKGELVKRERTLQAQNLKKGKSNGLGQPSLEVGKGQCVPTGPVFFLHWGSFYSTSVIEVEAMKALRSWEAHGKKGIFYL